MSIPRLGEIFNPDQDDLIRSVTPGGADSALDYRCLSNHIKLVRTTYLWTQADDDTGYASIPTVFDTPFADTNYVMSFAVYDVSNVPNDLGFFTGDIHNKTAAGFDAVVYSFSPGVGIQVGSQIDLEVIAIHL